jgi:LysR family glycine cleavage system transcriptional activator
MTAETEKRVVLPPEVKLPSRKSLPPFESLRAFDAVARLGGIRKAAKALHRDHAVISRHLRVIEDWTGTQLVERTPAGAVLTAQGRHYHRFVGTSIDSIAEATIDLIKNNKENSLNIWCMPGFALNWLINHIGSFEAANSALDIELRSTHEEPDFSRQDADVDIRHLTSSDAGRELPPNTRCVEFASPPVIAVACPEYLANSKDITHPMHILDHQLLHEEDFDNWRVWFKENDVGEEKALSGPRLWDAHMTMAAARSGRGIALSNPLVAAADLESGRLLEIGAGNSEFKDVKLWAYCLIARSDRWNTSSIRRFREWLNRTISSEATNST